MAALSSTYPHSLIWPHLTIPVSLVIQLMPSEQYHPRGFPIGSLSFTRISCAWKGAASALLPRHIHSASSTRFSLRNGTCILLGLFLSFKVVFWCLPQYSEKEDKYEEEIKLVSDKLKEVSVVTPS